MNVDTPDSGRILVIESDVRRHEEEIKDLNRRFRIIEPCADGINRIETLITNDLLPTIKILNEYRMSSEVQAKLIESQSKVPKSFWESTWGNRLWDIIRAAALVIATLLFAMNQHLLGVK
jgi:hypothetical protein